MGFGSLFNAPAWEDDDWMGRSSREGLRKGTLCPRNPYTFTISHGCSSGNKREQSQVKHDRNTSALIKAQTCTHPYIHRYTTVLIPAIRFDVTAAQLRSFSTTQPPPAFASFFCTIFLAGNGQPTPVPPSPSALRKGTTQTSLISGNPPSDTIFPIGFP